METEITNAVVERANKRQLEDEKQGRVVAARFDPSDNQIVIELNNQLVVLVPTYLAEGLRGAPASALSDIEISPSGLGLYWPDLDVDLYVPGLIQGLFGSRRWMAETLGAAGGRAKTSLKAAAARENGKLGGRPPKAEAATPPRPRPKMR